MEEAMEQPTEENVKSKKFWTGKKITLATFLVLILGFVAYRNYRDKAPKLVQTDDPNATVDYEKGETIDYRYLYGETQKKDVYPIEENGMREILRALGPLALEQKALAEQNPWEEIVASDWFKDYWTPICDVFQLDPNEKPRMLGRLTLGDYIAKNGFTGEEPEEPEESAGHYWENYEQHPARVNAYENMSRLTTPWTEKDYPNAARWIDENADFYDLLATAAQKPRMNSWHLMPEFPHSFIELLLPDVQARREYARLFSYRACLRIGRGDYSGAIDDIETITRLSEFLLDNESGVLVERLVAFACDGVASGLSVYANTEKQPSREDCERLAHLWSTLANGERYERVNAKYYSGETIMAMSVFQDMLRARREGLGASFFTSLEDGGERSNRAVDLFLRAVPINDARTMEAFKKAYEDPDLDPEAFGEENVRKGASWEDKLVGLMIGLIAPARNACEHAKDRHFCSCKLAAITSACFAYQAENGTLPPAFTVDESGAPLHSWRTLILPYLGDECRALYEQIKLDEPWDSEYNRQFHDQKPDVFRCDLRELAPNETVYSVLLGDDGFFDASGKGKNVYALYGQEGRDIARQTLIYEAPEPVCWMRPDAEMELDDLMKFSAQVSADGESSAVPEDQKYQGAYQGLLQSTNGSDYSSVRNTFSQYSSADGAVRSFGTSDFQSLDELYRILRGLPESPEEANDDSLHNDAENVSVDELSDEPTKDAVEAANESTEEETTESTVESTEQSTK